MFHVKGLDRKGFSVIHKENAEEAEVSLSSEPSTITGPKYFLFRVVFQEDLSVLFQVCAS